MKIDRKAVSNETSKRKIDTKEAKNPLEAITK